MRDRGTVFRQAYRSRAEAEAALERIGRRGLLVPCSGGWALEIEAPSGLPIDELYHLVCHSSFLTERGLATFKRLASRIRSALLHGLAVELSPGELREIDRLLRAAERRAAPRFVQGGAPGSGGGRKPLELDEGSGFRLPEGRDPGDESELNPDWEDEGEGVAPDLVRDGPDPVEMIDEMLAQRHLLTSNDLSWVRRIDRTVARYESPDVKLSDRQADTIRNIYDSFLKRLGQES